METIDEESRKNIKAPFLLDNFSDRYKTLNDIYTFTSPEMWTIEKNLFYLLKNSKKIPFEAKYKMKPDYLSYDEYGTTILAPLIMFINNVVSMEEFDLEYVIVPLKEAVVDICKDKFPKKTVEEMTAINF